ncbi:hypothetical protein OROHE_013690 [Orobanche hederae]
MRLTKGDKVEVMNKNNAPVSWHGAKILSSNGHTYRVQYDYYPGMANEKMFETVSRKFVRPVPPLVQGLENCINGDIVEVFFVFAWRIAAILRVLEGKKEIKSKKASGNRYLVRILGCSEELIVDDSNIRMRQIWHDDKWILIGKSCEDVIAGKPSTSTYYHMNFQIPQINSRAQKQPKSNCTNVQDELLGSDMIHSRSLKRMAPYESSIIEAHVAHAKKIRTIEKDGRRQRLLEKVDAVSYPRETLGEKNMHDSFNNIISTWYNQMERTNPDLNSSDNDACSVGSCSDTDLNPDNYCIPLIPFPCQETDTICSDAESCYGSGSERKSGTSFPPNEELEGSIRRLELHAYRRTLEALYVCGPLSWEQEALLTNLRIMLHISNDEHLMELKNLISAKTAINFR